MSTLDVFFGGVGATQPRHGRGLPCIFVRVGGCIVILDMGEGCQEAYSLFGLGMNKPLYIFISHSHGDHLLGLRPFLESLTLNRRREPVHLYMPLFARDYALSSTVKYSFPLHVSEFVGGEGRVSLPECGAGLSYRLVPHTALSYAFSLETEEKVKLDPVRLEADGIRGAQRRELLENGVVAIGGREVFLEYYVAAREPGIKITYSGDTLPSHRLASLAKNSDILIHEATLLTKDWEEKPEIPHSTPYYAAKTALLSRSRLLVLFHIGGRYENTKPLLAEARRVFPRAVMAERGMSIHIPAGRPRRFYIARGFRRPG